MIRFQSTGQALGSEIIFTVIVPKREDANKLFMQLWADTIAFENRFSRFKTDSELTRVNDNAGSETKVSQKFIDLARVASEYQQKTSGLYSPFVLPALQAEGYKGSWPNPKAFDPRLDYSKRSTSNGLIQINEQTSTITIPPDSAIDFGGIGKGYLLKELSHFLDTKHVKSYWLSLGGDIACSGNDIEDKPWKINVAKAANHEETAYHISNKNGGFLAIATSGITKRKGQGWHHIIDPRAGKSARTDILTSTVTSRNPIDSDIFAKCLVILGSDKSKPFIKKFGLDAYLQTDAGAKIHIDSLA